MPFFIIRAIRNGKVAKRVVMYGKDETIAIKRSKIDPNKYRIRIGNLFAKVEKGKK